MKKVLLCFGTRPEAIKMCSLVHELKKMQTLTIKVCVTAQHREMLDQVLSFFEVLPDYDLNLMTPNQTLNQLSGRMFSEVDKVLVDFEPDVVLVHGDTTTSTICALAGFYRGIKIAHVEAGLRTFNKYSPFPEEINRQLTGKIANYHFSPTLESKENLLKELVKVEDIIVTGNTVIDSLFWTIKKLDKGFTNEQLGVLKSKLDSNKKIILVTAHRRENIGEGFVNICNALKEISLRDDVQIIFPVHLNPNVRKPVNKILSNLDNVVLLEPLDYPSFVWAMYKSFIIITDSGGVQEEAPSLGKPVLVMRDTTERPEAVKAETVKLVGTDSNKIIEEAEKLLDDIKHFEKMSKSHNPYGDGTANIKIADFLNSL